MSGASADDAAILRDSLLEQARHANAATDDSRRRALRLMAIGRLSVQELDVAQELREAEVSSASRTAEIAIVGQEDRTENWFILFEGRDAAGKGGTIKRFMEHLNPRGARVVALEKPERCRTRSMVFSALTWNTCQPTERSCCFDRSWYNRAGVERVMGFCSNTEYTEFKRQRRV